MESPPGERISDVEVRVLMVDQVEPTAVLPHFGAKRFSAASLQSVAISLKMRSLTKLQLFIQ
jgi:hypothetical protein